MIKHLTAKEFKEIVFDYDNKENVFTKKNPVVVDFYAEWCGPCKTIAPILEELSLEYDGNIDIYKVNVEDEPEISSAFGIRSIPTILFSPIEGKGLSRQGSMPKESFKKIFKEEFGIEK